MLLVPHENDQMTLQMSSAMFSLQGVVEHYKVTESMNYVQYFRNILALIYNKLGYTNISNVSKP